MCGVPESRWHQVWFSSLRRHLVQFSAVVQDRDRDPLAVHGRMAQSRISDNPANSEIPCGVLWPRRTSHGHRRTGSASEDGTMQPSNGLARWRTIVPAAISGRHPFAHHDLKDPFPVPGRPSFHCSELTGPGNRSACPPAGCDTGGRQTVAGRLPGQATVNLRSPGRLEVPSARMLSRDGLRKQTSPKASSSAAATGNPPQAGG